MTETDCNHLNDFLKKVKVITDEHPNVPDIPELLIIDAFMVDRLYMIERYCLGEPVSYVDPLTSLPTMIGWQYPSLDINFLFR